MRLSIVTEKKGWILHRKAEEIAKKIPGTNINMGTGSAQIVYFVNYAYFSPQKQGVITVANFTHFNPNFLAEKFRDVAIRVDHCVAVSKETAKVLYAMGVPREKVSVIIVGADKSYSPKMTLGIVGRLYRGGRKGEHLVQRLLADAEITSEVQIVSANPGWGVPVWTLPSRADFYRSIDYLLVPSLIEGGPVPFMEALASGTLSIAPPLGVIPEFSHIEYETGSYESLKRVILEEKEKVLGKKRLLHSEICGHNWDSWADQHINLFEKLLRERGFEL